MSSCVKCANRAELLCSRCFDPYCSVSCHLQDWPEHRFACKPIPGLIKIEALLELKNGGSPKSKNAAAAKETVPIAKDATHVVKEPTHVVKEPTPVLKEPTPVLKEPTLVKEANSPKPALVQTKANHMPSKNNMAIEKPVKESPQMRRSTNIVTSAVEELTEMISTKPGLVVSDKDVSKISNHEEDTSKLSRNAPPKFLKLRPLKSETLQKPVKRYFLTELKVIPLREEKDVTLFVTDTSLLKELIIGALDNGNKARLEMTENVKKLAEYCAVAEKNNVGYHPEVGELCLAIFDEDKEWYRAFVMDKNAEKDIYNVQFVDYGNISLISSAKIMPITEELMFPTCTNLCFIKNVSDGELPKLQEYLEANTIIQGDVRYSHENDIYEIDITNRDAIFK